MLAEREYRAQEAQRSTVRGHTESGPGPRLGEIVGERLTEAGAPADSLEWDSRKRSDGSWQVHLQFTIEGRPQVAEWVFDPRRRHVAPVEQWGYILYGLVVLSLLAVFAIGKQVAAGLGAPAAATPSDGSSSVRSTSSRRSSGCWR